MKKSNRESASQKENPKIIQSIISVTNCIPVIGNAAAAATKPGSQASAAASAAAAVPLLGDSITAAKKTKDAADLSESGILDWIKSFFMSLAGIMKTGAKKLNELLFGQNLEEEQKENLSEDESIQKWNKLMAAVIGTNPHYHDNNVDKDEAKIWKKNCQRCVSAFEARMRGENVTAMPYSDDYPDFTKLRHPDGYLSVYQSPQILDVSAQTTQECNDKIKAQMAEWGEGARAIVRVKWKGGKTGHVFNAVQIDGQTQYVDPQTGNMNCETHFNKADPSGTRLIRTDNLDFNEDRKGICMQKEPQTE